MCRVLCEDRIILSSNNMGDYLVYHCPMTIYFDFMNATQGQGLNLFL